MNIRFATTADTGGCLAVYAEYMDTVITFETELPSHEEFAGRIRSYGAVYPWLVAEEDGVILGYAYAHRAQERAAYDWNAELYGALLALLQKQGVRNVYGIVTLPNPASEALHRHFGFRTVGAYDRSGYKNGRWLDVGIFEKQIGSFDGEPEPLQPIGAIADREEILRVYNQH